MLIKRIMLLLAVTLLVSCGGSNDSSDGVDSGENPPPESGYSGFVITDLDKDELIYAMVLQDDGAIVIAGTAYDESSDIILIRYNPDGSLDQEFGQQGVVLTDLYNHDAAMSIVQQADGKLVITGDSAGASDGLAMARYHSDGSLDKVFTIKESLTPEIHSFFDTIIEQDDGKLVLAGKDIARFNSDGSADIDFGVQGVVKNETGVQSLIQLEDDRLLVLFSNTLMCLDVDGSIDKNFGVDGLVSTDSLSITQSIIQQIDGRILVAGADPESIANVAMMRFHSDGSIDNSFGQSGFATVNFRGYINNPSVVQQLDGKLVVAASVHFLNENGQQDMAMVRLNVDGSPDVSFGEGGFTRSETIYAGNVEAIAQQLDGKLVLAGYSDDGSGHNWDATVARFNIDGTLDTESFGPVTP